MADITTFPGLWLAPNQVAAPLPGLVVIVASFPLCSVNAR